MNDKSKAVSIDDSSTFLICVVAKVKPRQYQNFFLAVSGTREDAVKIQNVIATKGFVANNERVFPDQIESLSLKVYNGQCQIDGKESSKYQNPDCEGGFDPGGDSQEIQGSAIND